MGRVRTLSVSLCIDSREELQPSLTLVGTERGFSRRDCPQLKQLAHEAPPSHPKKAYKRASESKPLSERDASESPNRAELDEALQGWRFSGDSVDAKRAREARVLSQGEGRSRESAARDIETSDDELNHH